MGMPWLRSGAMVLISCVLCHTALAVTQQDIDACYGSSATDDQAIEACSTMIQSGAATGPNLAAAYYNRGISYDNKGSYDLAIEDYSQAIQLRPSYPHAYYNRGVAYDNKEQSAQATQDFTQAITLQPDYALAYAGRCWVGAKQGDNLDQALADCNRALELDPTGVNALNNRGFVYLKMKKYSESVADYDLYINGDTLRATAYFGRGDAKNHLSAGSGEEDITSARRLDPDIAAKFANWGIHDF
jgi:tetratricopeptide (TPR) repeat protein